MAKWQTQHFEWGRYFSLNCSYSIQVVEYLQRCEQPLAFVERAADVSWGYRIVCDSGRADVTWQWCSYVHRDAEGRQRKGKKTINSVWHACAHVWKIERVRHAAPGSRWGSTGGRGRGRAGARCDWWATSSSTNCPCLSTPSDFLNPRVYADTSRQQSVYCWLLVSVRRTCMSVLGKVGLGRWVMRRLDSLPVTVRC